MKNTRVIFPSGELLLEGMLATPKGAGPFPAVIICHPHPLYGGDMDNNVIHSLSETLTQASFVSFRFNFRGVGGSQGEFRQGIGEQEDAKAAISFISTVKAVDSSRIGLALAIQPALASPFLSESRMLESRHWRQCHLHSICSILAS